MPEVHVREYHSLVDPQARYSCQDFVELEDKASRRYLDSLGLGRGDDSGFACASGPPAPALSEGILYDAVEVFAGEGGWSEGHRRAGLDVHPGFDLKCSASHDFLSGSIADTLVGLILRRVVLLWHFGFPCISWVTLRRPRVRSKS